MLPAVDEEIRRGKFTSVAFDAPISSTSRLFSVEGFQALESRTEISNQIMATLTDPVLNIIGVYGLGGVGKTTLLQQIAGKVEQDKLFDWVVMVTVTEPLNLKDIQTTIADKLCLKFSEEGGAGRADRLWKRMKKEKKILVILDNVLRAMSLKEIGIPFGNDHKGCKLLLASRYQQVLSRDMSTQKEFPIEFLPEEESWSLFKKMAGDVVEGPMVNPIAVKVAKKCGGWPVLIVTVAKALKEKSLHEWKDALKQLERLDNKDMEDKVYPVLELCLKHLKEEEAKLLFLLCGQLTNFSIIIQDLLRYSMGLGLFKGINKLDDARNRVHKLVSDLKASCLLLEGDKYGEVKMHDVVHNFAISLLSKNGLVSKYNEEFKAWPTMDFLQRCTAISFPFSKIHELPEGLEWPQLKSFIMFNEDPSLKIPNNFIEGMKSLQVLDLTGMHLLSLPSSLHFLENLQTLCLDHCVLGDIAIIGELKNLKILSFLGSDIILLPSEIGQLTNLQLLDLSECSKLEVISPKVLSNLSQLEDLYMRDSFDQWKDERNSQRNNASLAELKCLPNLITLEIRIPDASILPTNFFSENLERYKILIGDEWDWSEEYPTARMLKVKLNRSIDFELCGIKMLLEKTEDLTLAELTGIRNVVYELDSKGFQPLKHLCVEQSPEIQHIIDSKKYESVPCFPRLESLALCKLINMEKIFGGQLTAKSLGELKLIEVESCDRLRNLFSFSVARCLLKLQEIKVTECKLMEKIVAGGSEDDGDNINAEIEYTQLRSKEISSEGELPTPTIRFSKKVVFPNLEKLTLDNCGSLKYLFSSSMVKSLQQLNTLSIDRCESMEEVIVTDEEEAKEEEEMMIKKMFLPKLKQLELTNLPKLTRFLTYAGNLIEFPSLEELYIKNCPNLKTFISHSTCANLQPLFGEMVRLPSLKRLEIHNMDDLTKIWNNQLALDSFFRLDYLMVWNCKRLKNLFPASVARGLLQLKELGIFSCGVEEIVGMEEGAETATNFVFPQVTSLYLSELPELKCFYPGVHTSKWPKLKTLDVSGCEKVKIFASGIQSQYGIPIEQPLFLVDEVVLPNLEELTLHGCGSLKYLFSSSMVQSLQQLKALRIERCESIEEVIVTDQEEAKEEEERMIKRMFLPKLQQLELTNLPKLTRFLTYTGNLIEFPSLEYLYIYKCPDLKTFISNSTCANIQPLFAEMVGLPSLKRLEIHNMDDLTKIWNNRLALDSFFRLDYLMVHNCKRLKNLFPASVARGLLQLEQLVIDKCGVEEIVGKEEGAETATNFVFPQVTSLELSELPELKCFYPGVHTSKWPKLKKLDVYGCEKVEIFASGIQSQYGIPIEQPLFLVDEDTFPNLEELILKATRNMKEICLLYEGLGGAENEGTVVARVRELNLSKHPELMHPWKEDFRPGLVFEKLKTLQVFECGVLTILVPSSMSFQNLINLEVSKCHGLRNLVTPWTAKSLVQLTRMRISECEMMTEIIANEEGEAKDEINFSQLKFLKLDCLPSLTSFCSGNYAFEFPNLEDVIARQCPKMKIFSVGVSSTPKLEKVQIIPKLYWEGNLNATVQWLFNNRGGVGSSTM